MDFKVQNDKLREYYTRDFTSVEELINRLRQCLITGEKADFDSLNKDGLVEFELTGHVYVSIFQEFSKPIRFGSKRATLSDTLNRVVAQLRKHSRFGEFDLKDENKTRILLECITKKTPVDLKQVHLGGSFDENRFEPGITGLMMHYDSKYNVFLPSDSSTKSEMTFKPVIATIANKSGLFKDKKMTLTEKFNTLKAMKDAEYFLIESKTFITYGKKVIPLYRDNILYEDFDYNTLLNIFKTSVDWLEDNLIGNGQFTYYYNPTTDDNIDHEHPTRRPPDLYYNDLRHSGGVITLLRMYELTGDEKYAKLAKSTIDWVVEQIAYHKDDKDREAAYVYYNKKAKLGGVGIPLIAIMRYRIDTKDESYDRYIEGFVRHLLTRLTPDGEFMGYYIHPLYHNGEPLIDMTPEERNNTFSFYYPGEALCGLGMFVNNYTKNEELKKETIEKCKNAMRWIVDERPRLYADKFTALPSDGWLMQAIEEWAKCDGFIRKEDINFVFTDAQTMIDKMYKKDDTPYIDYEGGMYYNYGDHYYPDGARCEGLIAAYYLAKYLKDETRAQKILEAAKLAAKTQFQLHITKYTNYPHKNPKKSCGSIKFKVTRQWVRVDSIQHVACFFIRLYFAEHKKEFGNYVTVQIT